MVVMRNAQLFVDSPIHMVIWQPFLGAWVLTSHHAACGEPALLLWTSAVKSLLIGPISFLRLLSQITTNSNAFKQNQFAILEFWGQRSENGSHCVNIKILSNSLLEKCKSKPQWGIISHWSEWPSSKSLQTINAGESVEEREPSYAVGGNGNWHNHYGKQCGDCFKNQE